MEEVAVAWDGTIGVAESVAADERLLRAGRPAARAGRVAARTLSIGVGVPADAPWVAAIRAEGVPVVRRSSGGSAILHEPGDLLWSLVIPRAPHGPAPGFASAYAALGEPVTRALRSVGRAAAWTDPLCASDRFCLFGRRGRVLAVEGAVLGGAAQHLTRLALLHHGILGASIDRGAVARWFALEPSLVDHALTSLATLHLGDATERIGRGFLREIERDGLPNPVRSPEDPRSKPH